MRILISAGEASSDMYGAQLIAALRARVPDAEFFGVGGERMRSAKCNTVVDAHHLAVVGITEIVVHLPRIYSEFRKLLRFVDALPQEPDVAVVIDSPAFNFRVAREMHERGIPVIYYVAPQLWAWRQHRVQRIQKWFRKVLCIFPFEEEFYQEHAIDVEYVGHPQAHLPKPTVERARFAAAHDLDPAQTWIALLPGSRKKEVRVALADMIAAARELVRMNPSKTGLQFIIPKAAGLDDNWFNKALSDAKALIYPEEVTVTVSRDAPSALVHARAAVVASGTATVEAALLGTPFVCVYRVSPLTYQLARRMIKVPFVAMPNLIAGRKLVPELLQHEFTPENVARALEQIIPDGPARFAMLDGLSEVQRKLGVGDGSLPAPDRAAEAILRAIHHKVENLSPT